MALANKMAGIAWALLAKGGTITDSEISPFVQYHALSRREIGGLPCQTAVTD